MLSNILLGTAILLFALLSHAPKVQAACTNPTGNAGEMKFNKEYQVMQYCNDTNWRAMGAIPDNGYQNIGDTCNDGSIYAGLNYLSLSMYMADIESGVSIWKTSTGVDDISPDSDDDGWLNHLNRSGNLTDFPAFSACEGLTIHGQTDWYLPSRNELAQLQANNIAINKNAQYELRPDYYWSSTEANTTQAHIRRGTLAQTAQVLKNQGGFYRVRCVRNDGNKVTSIVPNGLVGHWRLDETSGTTAIDSSGSGNHGTMINGMTAATDSTSGKVKSAFVFSRDNVKVSGARLDNLVDLSICSWIKRPESATASTTSYVSKWNGSQGWSMFGNRQTNLFGFSRSGATMSSVIVPGNFTEWNHFCVTYDSAGGTDRIDLYVNASPIAANEYGAVGTLDDTGSEVSIGGSSFHTSSLDDVRIYGRVLSAAEVMSIYQARDANLRYNTEYRTPEYFNGDDWNAGGGQRDIFPML